MVGVNDKWHWYFWLDFFKGLRLVQFQVIISAGIDGYAMGFWATFERHFLNSIFIRIIYIMENIYFII